jgi:hypothetical protein
MEECMKREPAILSRYLFALLAIGLLVLLAPSRMSQAATAVPTLQDEFNGTSLDPQWIEVHGNPRVANGKLRLAGDVSERAELQSIKRLRYGVMQMSISSSSWKPQNQKTDSSFGFEMWLGANGSCHYSVVLKANGHLGLMRSQPDVNGNCSGDPKFQAHLPVSNWDQLRARKAIRFTLTWAPKSVTLHITAGSKEGAAFYFGTAEPTNALRIRLNADKGETYLIDYVRVVGIPWR